jgi:16S rRNA (cytosine1407-C5)-methyltransferase
MAETVTDRAERWEGWCRRLEAIFGAEVAGQIREGAESSRPPVLRVNGLRRGAGEAQELFGGPFLSWCEEALVLPTGWSTEEVRAHSFLREGRGYLQNRSSLLPVLALDPRPGDRVLDLCAAPGGKASHLAAHTGEPSGVTAVEVVRDRAYRLREVLRRLGAEEVKVVRKDGRLFRDARGYDRILVDAPCSSEGRLRGPDDPALTYWSERKIAEMAHKQKGLLARAVRLLRPGGLLVYSTCTYAPEENELILGRLLRRFSEMEVDPIALPPEVPELPVVGRWKGRELDGRLAGCRRIAPAAGHEGFFLARLRKVPERGSPVSGR